MTPFIRLHPQDDVLIARSQLVGGTQAENVVIKGLIPPGHKVATRDIAQGEPVRRYNQIIGFASKPIAAGEHVHTHNLEMGQFERDYAFGADIKPEAPRREPPSWASSARTAGSPRATTWASCPA
jgi:altronate hydrolase